MKTNDLIRTCLTTIREARADRSNPTLLGFGFTIAPKDGTTCLHRDANGVNFSASWNRGSVYFTKEKAQSILAHLAPKYEGRLELEIVHFNTMRDRAEESAKRLICHFFKHRHAFRNLGI